MELGQFGRHGLQDVLDEVVGVVRLQGVAAQPGSEEGPIEVIELSPGVGVRGGLAEAVQQTGRRLGQEVSSRRVSAAEHHAST